MFLVNISRIETSKLTLISLARGHRWRKGHWEAVQIAPRVRDRVNHCGLSAVYLGTRVDVDRVQASKGVDPAQPIDKRLLTPPPGFLPDWLLALKTQSLQIRTEKFPCS